MNKMLSTAGVLGLTVLAAAGTPPQPKVVPPPPPPVIAVPPPPVVAAPPAERVIYQQQPLSTRPVLVSPEQARAVIDKFKAAYPKLGNPRILIYVNRELVDEQSGMKLAGRTEKTESSRTEVGTEFQPDPNAPKIGPASTNAATISGGSVTIVGGINSGEGLLSPGKGRIAVKSDKRTGENTYRFQERPAGSLADKQTVRDLERLFGRPLRMAGAALADQRVATQLLGDNPLKAFDTRLEGEQARKDRAALAKIADVVLEILISSRNLTLAEVSGDKVYAVPDIQATAIRLKDARIIGQATAADIIGVDRYAGRVVRNFDVREISEATALALMEDMLMSVEH
jgi:hypothetical protein